MGNMLLFLVKGISGGTATLSYRIGQKFQNEGYDVYYIYELANDTNNEKMLIGDRFKLIRTNERKWKKTIIDTCKKYKNAILITYTIDYFTLIDTINIDDVNIHKYLYVVSTASIVRGASKKGLSNVEELICRFSNNLNRRYIENLYINRQLMFMDDVTIKTARHSLSLPFNDAEKHIFLLPYNIKEKPEFRYKKDNIIITMSRISFPFKEYLIGLIDAFTKIVEKTPCELWVIGDGESRNVLEAKIASLPVPVKKQIKMFNTVSYDKIDEILNCGKVFVGMGTSILDASSNGVPSLAVSEYRTDCVGKGWFIDHPQYVGFLRDDNEVHSLMGFLLDVFNMGKEEYVDLSKAHYKCVVEYYSMDSFYNRLIEDINESKHQRNKHILGPMINKLISDSRQTLACHRCNTQK